MLGFSISAQWRSLPIRSQQEFNASMSGGEGEQYLHGMSRCLTQPDYIYVGQDVCGSWRSIDGGTTWKKNKDKGLYMQYSQSIEVDPIDPNKVFIAVDQGSIWMGKVLNYEGIYQSLDGGESWIQVLNSVQSSVRKMRHLIAYSLPSMANANTSPTRWYSADSQSLWRSDLSGNSGSWSQVASIPTTSIVTDVITHPTSIDTVYVATESGLYISTNGGANLAAIPFFASKKVTAVLMNKALPNKVYVTVSGEGIYISTDKGATFSLNNIVISGANVNTSIYRAVMNPGFPEQIYLIGAESSNKNWVTNNGMVSWSLLPSSVTFPGLGRETGWRRYLDGVFCGICPNPSNKTNAIGTSRSTFHKITNSGALVSESATGFTGNASMQTDFSIAFHPYDKNVFGIFCFDVGPRMTSTEGNWFYPADPILYTWRTTGITKWAGSYSAAFQPLQGSKVVLASIGHYISGGQSQIMRSSDNGLSWGANPVTVVNGDVTSFLQPYHCIVFDPVTPTIVYAGSLVSTDAGLTFSQMTFPSEYLTPTITYAPTPSVCGISKASGTNVTSVFAVDGNRKYILRSDDHGVNWFLFANLSALGGSAKYLDSSPTVAVHPTNPNVIFTLDGTHDLMKVTYNPTIPSASKVSLNVFSAMPSWIPTDVKAINQIRRIGIDPIDPNVMYVTMLISGMPSVYRSLDGGQTWASISDELNYQGGCVVVNPHTREVYKGSMSGTSIYPSPLNSLVISPAEKATSLLVYVDTYKSILWITNNEEFTKYSIYSISGRLMKQFEGNSTSLLDLSPGMYVLTARGHSPVKFVK
ncbi:MAG: hypothetical protein PHV20_02175 [Bacteroidales bacterium]|nr:hypothetical protein [Bacteroidales bacterium]